MRTSAAFTAASAASTQATRPRVSIIPSAFILGFSLRYVHDIAGLDPGGVGFVRIDMKFKAVFVGNAHDDVLKDGGAAAAGPGADADDLAGGDGERAGFIGGKMQVALG